MNTHQSVLLNESIDCLIDSPQGVYVDGTYGRGGHSRMILNRLNSNGKLIAIDQDLEAVKHGQLLHKKDSRFQIFHENYKNLDKVAHQTGMLELVDGILIDAGVSSPQLDQPQRGFSFNQEGPLDMRMDNSTGNSAFTWLQKQSIQELGNILKKYGDIRNSMYWAKLIKQDVVNKTAFTTKELSDLIEKHTPEKVKRTMTHHPATKIFQAIRIAVNDELNALDEFLQKVYQILKLGGRLVTITFHSLEHRMLRKLYREDQNHLPIRLPIVNSKRKWKVIEMLKYPGDDEININPRARSARLSVLQKI